MKKSASFLASLAKKAGLVPEKLGNELQSGRAVLLGKKHPLVFGAEARTHVGAGGAQNFLSEAKFFLCTENNALKLSAVLRTKKVPTGTVPLYALAEFDHAKFLHTLETQLKLGADFVVLSPGVTLATLPALQKRKTCLSRSAQLLVDWMAYEKRESPLFERFEEIIARVKKYEAVLYFATSLRPQNFAEVGDLASLKELEILGRLVLLARREGVPTVIEGPDLLPFSKIVEQITLLRDLAYGAPLIFRGPRILEHDPNARSASLGGVLASFIGASGLITDTLGIPKNIARQNFSALALAAEAGTRELKV